MLVMQLTDEESVQPETVTGLTNVDAVFKHFKPTKDVEMENAEGSPVKETMKFGKLDDFSPKGIVRQSPYLNKLRIEQEQYFKVMKQLKSNKVLQTMLANPETKGAVIDALKNIASELEAANSK